MQRFLRSRAAAPIGRYFTPRRARGMSAMMISALKITAERIADCGVCKCMMFSAFRTGNVAANMAGMMAKYLATSLAIEKVVSAPRVIRTCLPISTISMSLVGFESRSTMLPASLAAWVPVFMATPTSAWARASASLVPSPVMATSLPSDYSRLMVHLVSWFRFGEEVVDAGLARDSGGGEWLSPVIMMVLMPMARSWANRSFMPPLTMSLR